MLYQGSRRMQLARWPNPTDEYPSLKSLSPGLSGNVSYSDVIDRGYQSQFVTIQSTSKISTEFATGVAFSGFMTSGKVNKPWNLFNGVVW